MTCENLLQLSIVIILFMTFLSIIWYAWHTRNLWKEAVKQTRLSMRPIVVITYDDANKKFRYINYGNTPAFSIKIADVTLINTNGLKFCYVFPEIYCVPQSTKINIENIKIKINDVILIK